MYTYKNIKRIIQYSNNVEVQVQTSAKLSKSKMGSIYICEGRNQTYN